MMKIPDDREYTATHEWVQLDGETATIGVTADDASALEAIKVEIVPAGRAVKRGDRLATIISAELTRELLSPLSGSIVEINSEVARQPGLLQLDPFGQGWICRLRVEAGEELEHLLEPGSYAALISADSGGSI